MVPTTTRQTSVLWALFAFDGRLGRQSFWLGVALMYSSLSCIALALLPRVTAGETIDAYFAARGGDPVFLVLLALALWTELALAVKRLHDRGLSGFFAIVLALPLLNFVAFIVIGLMSGTPGPNRFGLGPDTRGPAS